ncbi:pancreatic lipase-related protein [Plakobranchus ocellatus]|uniref:Pancreatic lipase-related protein n=1 Tax=Plakobranchus ocellatus TaxID=259542 RepID=A0AAV3ZTX6_9GAST|nr:pancreatic lipase-related protein [Plakobranchus ocellatus]
MITMMFYQAERTVLSKAERNNPWYFFRRCCVSDLLPNGCECFDISPSSDFTNSLFHLPKCPQSLGVIFYFYDRDHTTTSLTIAADSQSIESTPFSSQRNTAIIAHGFADSGTAQWILEMKDELLNAEDLNVILVDWKKAAKGPNYFQAVANTRTVGAMLGRLLQALNSYSGAGFEVSRLFDRVTGCPS